MKKIGKWILIILVAIIALAMCGRCGEFYEGTERYDGVGDYY